MHQEIEALKNELENKVFDQGFHWKILFIGRSVNGTTDIVSSLSRSLRNLGHHVLDLDTGRHKILSNPYRRQGGMGPIFVDYEKLEPYLDSFEPQMIICCAGGLTLTEEDAEKIKSRGIVLVGITLSDPDVFPSIRDYQHVFDFHTTNATEAMAMYKESGVHNTLYFPFGIDRGFVTQNVPAAKKFEADVICLGHATNRPDRNEMMTGLAKSFDVKTYGRGWEIPGSFSVSGIETVQALREGKIHINFPLTRAGYINIKCGVFESIAQGRVVATGVFDEMSHFFDYGSEIIGYETQEDLETQIQALLDDPERYDEVALNGFKKLVSSHLYEHRWMDLFAQIRDPRNAKVSSLSDQRISEIERTLSASLPRAKKIIVSGFYGARNLGDEMILRSIKGRLQESDPSVQVVVASENPVRVEKDHGLQSFTRKNHSISGYQVKTASGVILGGGGLWHDYTFALSGGLKSLFTGAQVSIAGFGILPLLARVLERPVVGIGLGAGPLSEPDAKNVLRYLASQFESIYLRDNDSRDILLQAKIPAEKILVGPDTVYAVDLSKANQVSLPDLEQLKERGYTLVGVNLRSFKGLDLTDIATRLNDAIQSMRSDVQKIALVALPMQAGAGHDIKAIKQVFDLVGDDVETFVLHDSGKLSLDEYTSVLCLIDVTLAMRLHASLLSHRMGTPAVGLNYDPKVGRHFDEVNRSNFCLPMDFGSDDIASALMSALNERISNETTSVIEQLERDATDVLNDSISRVLSGSRDDYVYEVPSEDEVESSNNVTVKKAIDIAAAFAGFSFSTNLKEDQPDVTATGRAKSTNLQFAADGPRLAKGTRLLHSGFLTVNTSQPVQISLSIVNRYNNPRAKGYLETVVNIGDEQIVFDPATSSNSIKLNYLSKGTTRIPMSIELRVKRNTFRARSWHTATKHTIQLEGVNPAGDVEKPALLSTRNF